MKIAYLVNQYPKVSHSFIRREILALEACGVEIVRFSIRACGAELVDEADRQELVKTQVILDVGVLGLLTGLVRVAVTRPRSWFQALGMALRLGRGATRNLAYQLAYLAEACILLRRLSAASVEHLHVHFGTNSTTVAMLCQALGGPTYSFTVHGPEEFDQPEAIALRQKIERAAFVIAISSFGKSQLYRCCDHADWGKIHEVHCGVDETFLTPSPLPITETPQLVCVARLSLQKGHLLLLDAIAPLAAAGLPFKLILVGDGELRPQIEALIAQHHLQERVEITGWASGASVRQHILNSRLLVLPSFAEGLPVVLMEALALGRPVLGTYVAGIPELIEPDASGWLVPAGSVERLTEAIRAGLQLSAADLEQMGQHGRARVMQQYNAATEARKLAALMQHYPSGILSQQR